jgi:hypothetical protein
MDVDLIGPDVDAFDQRGQRGQRRAGLVNTAGNVSVGRYSSTAGPNRRFATVVAVVR